MSTIFRFLLTAIALVSMVHSAQADSARDPAEALPAGTILGAGEIDRSTVDVGAFFRGHLWAGGTASGLR